jgi:Cu-Zn family superoxide dismutase
MAGGRIKMSRGFGFKTSITKCYYGRILMRNRTWMAVIAMLAVMVIAVKFQKARSQARAARGAQKSAAKAASHADMETVTYAVATAHGLGDHKVKGKVTFTQQSGGVEIVAELSGLEPGEHGFHIHEFGDCSMADGKCAGAHFNPTNQPHGGPDDAKRHAGDFGNIKADDSGKATYKRVDKMITLNGRHSIIGRSVILHAKPDDLKTQPSGNAGDRIGCGTIGIGDPKMMAH